MTSLDDLAPYPDQPDNVTADAIARFETVDAFAHTIRSHRLSTRAGNAGLDSPEMGLYVESMRAACAQIGVIHLLRAFQAAAPEQAEEAARQLWDLWDDGASSDWLSDLLSGYGIDAEQIMQMVDIEAAKP